MKSTTKRILNTLVLVLLCLALGVFAAACSPETTPESPKPPVKVSDGISFELGVGDSKNLSVADYITVYYNAVDAESDSGNASASVAEGLLTVTGVTEGSATVTLTCGDISVTFEVTVYAKCAVTVDGKATYVKKGEEYTLPSAPTIADEDMEFDHWLVGGEQKSVGDTITVDSDVTVTSVTKRKAPVKIKDGGAVSVSTSGSAKKELNVSEYITTHGNPVTAQSGDAEKVTVAIQEGKIVLTAVAEGTATVTVTCGAVGIEFEVTVTAEAPASYTVTVDGDEVATVNDGESYTMPAEPTVDNPDFEFIGWKIAGVDEVKQPGDTVTVESDLTITAKIVRKAVEKIKDGVTVNITVDGSVTSATIDVNEYIDKHGNAANITASSAADGTATAVLNENTLTITAVAVGNTTVTLTCGDVTVTFTVNVSSTADGTPEFQDGNISFDLFEKTSDSYAFVMSAPSGYNYTYEYSVSDTNATVSGNTLTYTATAAVSVSLTVNVTATDAEKNVTKTTTFTVTVTVTDTTPVANNSAVTDTTVHDLYDGALTVNLTSNIDNTAAHVGTYTVNGTAVTDPTAYAVTGSYTDTVTDVELTVEATFGIKTVTYTYSLMVIDTAAYRLVNGGFENDLNGWTKVGEIGNISAATAYWTNENDGAGYSFNADGKFFSAYEPEDKFEGNIGTLTSSTFKVSNNRVITFKLGGAQHDIFVDVVDNENGAIIARYGNSAWAETTNELKSGCTLIAYKAVLPESAAGKTVYIRVIDMATSYYGVLFCDSFVTYYSEAPASGFIDAVDVTARPATIYDIYNGGFESDMVGWTVSGGDIGAVTSDKSYWNGGNHESTANAYGQEGEKLFSWWSWNPDITNGEGEKVGGEVNREGNMGTLTSNMFVLKAGKYVSFKFGGGGNRNVFIELVNAESGAIIAVFRNDNIEDGKLKSYSYKVDELSVNSLCYFRIVDNAVSGWGCFTADDFKVNLDSAPEGSAAATNRVSEYAAVVNGSFENGNLDGWTMISQGALGAVVNTEKEEGWYQTNENAKDGDYLFTFYYGRAIEDGTEYVNEEGSTGIIRSSAFILEKNGIVSFRFGAAHNPDVYINLYTTGGKLLATFRNNAWTKDTEMVHYYYQFDNAEEVSCYFEVVDNATGNYGCIVMDDFRVNLDAVPTGAVLGSAQTKA